MIITLEVRWNCFDSKHGIGRIRLFVPNADVFERFRPIYTVLIEKFSIDTDEYNMRLESAARTYSSTLFCIPYNTHNVWTEMNKTFSLQEYDVKHRDILNSDGRNEELIYYNGILYVLWSFFLKKYFLCQTVLFGVALYLADDFKAAVIYIEFFWMPH